MPLTHQGVNKRLCLITRRRRNGRQSKDVEAEDCEVCQRKSSASPSDVSGLQKGLPTIPTNPPPPDGGGGFANYAIIPLHCLRIYLDASYRMTIDLLDRDAPNNAGDRP